MTKKRRRCVHLHVMVTPEEQALIGERMAEAGISNMGAYMRKMALNGYVLHVDLSDIRELVSLQRRCANNLNQVAIHVNTYGGIYPDEIKALQRDYADLWAAVRSAEKAVGGGGALTCRGVALCCSPAFFFGTNCPEVTKRIGTRRRSADLCLVPVLLHRT